MGLSDRINEAAGRNGGGQNVASGPGDAAQDRLDAAFDRQSDLKTRIHSSVIRDLGSQLYREDIPEPELLRMVRTKIDEGLTAEHVPMPRTERQEMVDELVAEVIGYGPIEEFLRDPTVTEVMVNGHHEHSTSSATARSWRPTSASATTATCVASSRRSWAKWDGAWTSPPPTSTPASPTAPGSTSSCRRLSVRGAGADHPQVLGRALHRR